MSDATRWFSGFFLFLLAIPPNQSANKKSSPKMINFKNFEWDNNTYPKKTTAERWSGKRDISLF